MDLEKELILAQKTGEIEGFCPREKTNRKMDYMGAVKKDSEVNYLFSCQTCGCPLILTKKKEIQGIRFRYENNIGMGSWKYIR